MNLADTKTFYFPPKTASIRWANDKRMLTYADWTVCERSTEFGDRYVNGKLLANAERKPERWLNSERTVNSERKVKGLFGRPRVFSTALSI